jgi:hypothetical protein
MRASRCRWMISSTPIRVVCTSDDFLPQALDRCKQHEALKARFTRVEALLEQNNANAERARIDFETKLEIQRRQIANNKRQISSNKRSLQALAVDKVMIVANEVLLRSVYKKKRKDQGAKRTRAGYVRLANEKEELLGCADAISARVDKATFVNDAMALRKKRNNIAHCGPEVDDVHDVVGKALRDFGQLLAGVEDAKFSLFVLRHAADFMSQVQGS